MLKSLREAPSTVPALAAVALFIVWATDQAGYPVTHWGPGGLIVLALLVIALAIVGLVPGRTPAAVLVSVGCLAAYTAFSFLSILWADVPGDAWEGANRTLLYLLVFALFALWRQRGRTAALILGCWLAAMTVLAAYVAVRASSVGAASLHSMFPSARLDYPSGYPNANAAEWLMAFWPAVLLARGARVPAAVRGLLAGSGVVLAGMALLSQSRGSLYATPVMILLVLAFVPGRWRSLGVLVAVGAGVGAAAPAILRVGDHLSGGQVTAATVHTALSAIFIAALVAGLAVWAAAALIARQRLSEASLSRVDSGGRVIAAVLVVLVIAAGLAVAGNPVTRVESAWHSFKGGYSTTTSTESRLVSGLGSNRYDFYRVALDEFASHPLIGIGADNFQQQYLARGRSEETPHYPHSVEIRTLSQTGLIGALLALVGLGAALLAAVRAMRGQDALAGTVAAAALGGFMYWLVHGSFDWFWEFAGLGAPAFAMLGLACSLAPSGPAAPAPERQVPVRGRRIAVLVAGVLVTLAAAASLAAPWLSALEVQSAARVWTRSPSTAYARLHDASRLDPLSDQAYLVAGSIALRLSELPLAAHYFELALARTPGDDYATLELGAIASSRGERAKAIALLARAVRLNRRDFLARQALATARAGQRVDVRALNRAILAEAEHFA